MATDSSDTLQNDIWAGSIPIELSLSAADDACLEIPLPVCVLASRMGYFIQVASAVVEHFQGQAIEFRSSIWFEAGGVPLKSYLPIGVQYDMFGTQQRHPNEPWRIVVHFQPNVTYNEDESLNSALTEKLYFHGLKQALQLLHGSTSAFNSLSLEQQGELWRAPARRQWDGFSSVRQLLLCESPSDVKHLPIRTVDTVSVLMRQRLVKPFTSSGQSRTLVDVLTADFNIQVSKHCDIIIQGLRVNADLLGADVYTVWKLFAHADLFLYLVVGIPLALQPADAAQGPAPIAGSESSLQAVLGPAPTPS